VDITGDSNRSIKMPDCSQSKPANFITT